VVVAQDGTSVTILRAINEQSKKDSLATPRAFYYPPGQFDPDGIVKQIKAANCNSVFFPGGGADVLSFMREADKTDWHPIIFVAGAANEIFDAPPGFSEKIFISLPSSPVDQTPEALREFSALSEKYKLPSQHLAVQMYAYGAAKILAEAIRRAGRDLSREKLIKVLEGFYEYQTGVTPAVTYGPNRRIGAMGAYIIKIDLKAKQFMPTGWVSVH
jgi:ABC-type branched-subunit amino acid transport system substrate-binding protein